MNDFPIVLKAEDSAPAPDLQATMIELSEMANALVNDCERLRDLHTRWGTDPTGICRRAQPQSVDVFEQAAQVRDLILTLSQGYRAAAAYSVAYSDGRGVV